MTAHPISCFHTLNKASSANWSFTLSYICKSRQLPPILSCNVGKRFSHYDTLGVKSTASNEEIRNAYLKLAQKNQPNLLGNYDSSSMHKFLQVQAAFDVLGNEKLKAEYDLKHFKVKPNQGFTMKGFNKAYFISMLPAKPTFNSVKRAISDVLPRPVHKLIFIIYKSRWAKQICAVMFVLIVFLPVYISMNSRIKYSNS